MKKRPVPGSRFLAKKYALTQDEADALASKKGGVDEVEAWREANGLPHPTSSLVRGMIWQVIGVSR